VVDRRMAERYWAIGPSNLLLDPGLKHLGRDVPILRPVIEGQ